MKKALFALAAFLAVPALASAQNTLDNVRIPSGYQAHIEYSNVFFLKDGETGMSISTTHGFFYTDKMHVGLGLGLMVSPEETYVPVFTSAKYVFNHSRIAPTAQMRLGSFFHEGAKPYADAALGLRFASDRDFAFSVLLAGSFFAPFKVEDWTYDHTTDRSYVTYFDRNLSNLSLRVGIEW